jgi:hypothetical protein
LFLRRWYFRRRWNRDYEEAVKIAAKSISDAVDRDILELLYKESREIRVDDIIRKQALCPHYWEYFGPFLKPNGRICKMCFKREDWAEANKKSICSQVKGKGIKYDDRACWGDE